MREKRKDPRGRPERTDVVAALARTLHPEHGRLSPAPAFPPAVIQVKRELFLSDEIVSARA
jgi:hypothetical protein